MDFVNTHVYGRGMDDQLTKDRLTRSAWLDHGLRILARQGADALKVGALATGLNVSRGSFYWHFKDISEFRLQLLQRWQERTTDQVIEGIDASVAGAARLTHLMKLAFNEDRSLDRAIRAMASTDADVAKMVASVDARRVGYMAKWLIEAGVESQRALPRAEFLYWAYIGQSAVMDPRHSAITELDVDDLSALFTR
ncbi:TetR/AcrR family transcriptional regulator [Tardiphaga sp. 42S5]|uniref:TetR/AcrR family transcriptional regulator n=1 Tax=Tardiphaga sp. 42S5 TaxID=1404799 RepID=UPI002A59DA84|nr:TetR/AcrR family transcriptional regulator [Tardiphaga sp. 42S5]WPO42717.1 TetR/AcrR family transcriptional regulator [Tardiphaga sp. 42S5]